MNETVNVAMAFMAGILLGAIFFGGLWWTIRQVVSANWPALWFCGSLLLRTAIVLAGFYSIGIDRWQRLLACLLGFFVARLVVTRLVPESAARPSPAQEASHAHYSR
jgi:F1F0 ATPase subunit 2